LIRVFDLDQARASQSHTDTPADLPLGFEPYSISWTLRQCSCTGPLLPRWPGATPPHFPRKGVGRAWVALAAETMLDTLATIPDFLDGLPHGASGLAHLAGLVADLIILPARHSGTILFAAPAGLLSCHCVFLHLANQSPPG
jgi:hypothetical protein